MYEIDKVYQSGNMGAISRMVERARLAGYGANYGRYVSDHDPPQKPSPKKKRRAKQGQKPDKVGC